MNSVKEITNQGVQGFLGLLHQAWSFQLFAIDNRSITIGNLTVALFFLVLGSFLSKSFSRIFKKFMLQKFSVDSGVAATFESLAFYSLLIVFSLFALNISNIPLTIFTVLGGAIALGVGFGSQNIVRNFISGLILLIERPIQVGDIIDVDGTRGEVERIGTRSTRVRSYQNIDIVVPNSDFLEKNVVNWTLGDNKFRTHITVGVAYGSPVDKVTDLLIKAAGDHKEILEYPKPVVLFTNFGDNALTFELYFWTYVKDLFNVRRVESDLRYAVDSLFREAGVVIAFPQRDLHLGAHQPLQVQVVKDNA